MTTRKEIKKRAKKVVKRHRILYIAICLIAAYMGTEFSGTLANWDLSYSQVVDTGEEGYDDETVERVSGATGISGGLADVAVELLSGNEKEGKAMSDEFRKREIDRSLEGNPAFGRSRGVLAAVVNSVTSGSILVSLLAAINSIVKSENAAILLLILLGAAAMFCVYFFIINVFRVVVRRIFLEGRTYEKVPLQRMLFLLRVKKWTKACWTMFVTSVFLFLWNITIIGGIIKTYSYFLVPYIVAENPDISALEAISLSRRMMNGHKWQCFLYHVSFLPWIILGMITFGISNILFYNPYYTAVFSEYYTELREEAKQKHLKGERLLNDTYLFKKPEEELIYLAYEDVISAMVRPVQNQLQLTGIRKFLADYLGLLLVGTKKEKEYEETQAARVRMEFLKDAVDRRAYPSRLSAVPEVKKRKKIEMIHYMRHYTIWSVILQFFFFSFIGWIWEVSLHLVADGSFVNRGVLHGPWLPIYGAGGVLILMFLNRLRARPLAEFVSIIVLCGIVEYVTSYVLERLYDGERWWDYSGYFLNLNGRICAEGLLVFGIGGMAIVYILAPMLDNVFGRIPLRVVVPVCAVCIAAFVGDGIYSAGNPNSGRGITDYESRKEAPCLPSIYHRSISC